MNEFDKVGLYDHNAESYKKVRDAFKESNVVGIVHATGTGKSYNALQLAYDSKDKKILWLVPNNAIIEHIIKSINDNPNLDLKKDFPNLEFMTYPGLINLNDDELMDLNIDLLVLDEFHHTGAPVWGSVVNSVIETHPNIKVFGMTAYTVRDRGTSYERDMALDEGDELFSDNIVSRYDLCDAMIDGVLPKPIYKSSYIKLIDMAQELENRVKRLEASGRECSEYNTILSDVKKRLHEAPSLKDIVLKNIKNNGKYIYFCPPVKEEGVNDIETIKKEALSWFKEIAPEEDIVFYTSLSEMKDSGKSNREAFYDDLDLDGNKVDGKLRVMFCINQYNEGVHAPNIDGVILGRGTCSDIVFFEQIGRALSVSGDTKKKVELYSKYSIERLRMMCALRNLNYNGDNTKEELIEKLVSPIIIDLAGNIDFIRELEDNLKDRIKEYQEKGDGTLIRRKLTDTSFDLDTFEVDLFNILTVLKQQTEMTWDDWYKLAKEYYEENGDLDVPAKYITLNGEKLGQWISFQRLAYKNRSLSKDKWLAGLSPLTNDKIKKLESIGIKWNVLDSQWGKMYELAQQYYQERKNLKIPKRFVTKDGEKLGQWIQNQKLRYKQGKLSQDRIDLLESIGMIWNVLDSQWKEMYELAKAYYEKHGDLEIPADFRTFDGYTYNKNSNIFLGLWVIRQRKYSTLESGRGKLLLNIGMRYENKRNVNLWDEMYKLAKTYFEEYGNLDIPTRFVTKNGEKLGIWISNQRKAYKNRTISKEERVNSYVPLTDEQVELLESIGMIWDTKKNKSDIEELCRDNNIDMKKNKSIISHISYIEFKVKISYLIDNGISIVDNGVLHEIFSMSNINMKSKYGVSLEELVKIYKEMNR